VGFLNHVKKKPEKAKYPNILKGLLAPSAVDKINKRIKSLLIKDKLIESHVRMSTIENKQLYLIKA
jgi:hypothetical protein